MFQNAMWVGIPTEEYQDKHIYQNDANGRFAYFRLDFELPDPVECVCALEVSANSRYRLWVNGKPAGSGPCRGDRWRHFSEQREIAELLRPGKNCLAAQVLLSDFNAIPTFGDQRMPLISVADAANGHRFAVEGRAGDISLTTGEADWRVWLDNSFYLECLDPVNANMGAITEEIDFNKSLPGWKLPDFDTLTWKKAVSLEPVKRSAFMEAVGFLPPLVTKDRPIPLLFEEAERLFTPGTEAHFPLTLAPGSVTELTLSLKAHSNAYFRYFFHGGKNARVSFTYFERYVEPEAASGLKPDENRVRRDDAIAGAVPPAQTDSIILPGGKLRYEPFWYRTARFLKIRIETGNEGLKMDLPQTLRMGYPLDPEAEMDSSSPWVKDLFTICVRTLQNCMTDAYMDCPYYEQIQYPMDTRLQALFTYAVSRDTKLARKALKDIHSSMTPWGFVQGRAPSGYIQIISTFSFFYLHMLLEYWERTGAVEVLQRYRSDCGTILDAFERYTDRKTGLIGKTPFWDFVDWLPEWGNTGGQPAALYEGPSAVVSLMYACAMETSARIYELTGSVAMAAEIRMKKKTLLSRIRESCYDGALGLVREGPDFEQFCQVTQSWAVLAGLLHGEDAVYALRRSVEDERVLKCCFSTSYEFFRACELAGCYEQTAQQMELWKSLLGEHCTTVPETPTNSRSECHGWSALPIYELIRVRAGICQVPGKPDSYTIKPCLGELNDLSGCVPVKGGLLRFSIQGWGTAIRSKPIPRRGSRSLTEYCSGSPEIL